MAKLGDVCTIYAGTGFPVQYQGNSSGAYPFYKVGDIAKNVTAGNVRLAFCENYVEPDVAKRIKSTIIPPDTIVFAKIGEAVKLNRRAITSCDCIIDNNAMGIRPNEDFLSLSYFYHFMCNLHLENLAEATTVPSVKKSRIESIDIPLPSLQEQAIISNKLDKISDGIIFRKRQLAKLDELVKARFVEMFGNPVQPESKWRVSTFGDEFHITSGGTPDTKNSAYWEHGTISWIGSNMCQDEIVFQNDGKYITTEGLAHSSAKVFESGTVLVALVGATIGKTALLRFSTATNQNVAAIDVNKNKNFTAEYVYYQLQFLYPKFQELGNGTFKMANQAFIRELPILCPPHELQVEFSDFIEDSLKLRLTIRQGLDKMETLKRALMQEYFG